jgi:pyruvate,water dikinase
LAAWALHDARAAGWDDSEIVARAPVVLALSPPSLDTAPTVPTEMMLPSRDAPSIDGLGSREALRLRARWLQELGARLARELGRRLVDEGALPDELLLGEMGLAELVAVAGGGPPPSDLARRRDGRTVRPLPTAFRLSVSGEVRPAGHSSPIGRRHESAGLPASGGRAVGVVVHDVPVGQPVADAILVTHHLEPQLAPVLGHLAGLVSETGSALSHLAILAREAGLPTVVGVPDAVGRFPPGATLEIDGSTGEIEVLDRVVRRVGAESDAVVALP